MNPAASGRWTDETPAREGGNRQENTMLTSPTETPVTTELAAAREALASTNAERAAGEATKDRLADEAERLRAVGSDASKVEQNLAKTLVQLDVLRAREEAQERRLRRLEELEASAAKAKVKADAVETMKVNEGVFAAAAPRLTAHLLGASREFAILADANAKAQTAASVLGPGVSAETYDPTHWLFLEKLMDEVRVAALTEAGAPTEAFRVNVLLRVPPVPAREVTA